MRGVINQRDILQDVCRRPAPRHQLFARFCRVGGTADGLHDLVDIGDGDGQTTQNVTAFTRFAQQIGRAACNDVFAKVDKGGQETPQRQRLWTPPVERQHVAAEISLHLRETEQLVHHHFCRRITLEFNDHTHPAAVGFVLYMGDAIDLFLADLLCDWGSRR